MILVSTIGFAGMPVLVMWPQNTSNIALWVKHPRFVVIDVINVLVSVMGFPGMPDIVVLSENI